MQLLQENNLKQQQEVNSQKFLYFSVEYRN